MLRGHDYCWPGGGGKMMDFQRKTWHALVGLRQEAVAFCATL